MLNFIQPNGERIIVECVISCSRRINNTQELRGTNAAQSTVICCKSSVMSGWSNNKLCSGNLRCEYLTTEIYRTELVC